MRCHSPAADRRSQSEQFADLKLLRIFRYLQQSAQADLDAPDCSARILAAILIWRVSGRQHVPQIDVLRDIAAAVDYRRRRDA